MSRFAAPSARSRQLFSLSSTLTSHFAQVENLQPRTGPRCGWQANGATCDFDPLNSCCSQYGYCGNSSEYCQGSQGCQSGCIPTNGRCGSAFGGTRCQDGCCSKDGYCGSTDDYCLVDNGCQSGCAYRSNSTSTSPATEGFPSYTAKIGLITGGAVFGACLITIGLYVVWRCRRRRLKTFDLNSDVESDVASTPVTNQFLNRRCMGCSQSKLIIAAFPGRRITADCNHEPGFCLQCLETTINTSLAQDGWEQVRCPENGCNVQLEETDVRAFATFDDFQRYLARRRGTETRECQICVNDRTVATEFPNRPVTDQCQHPPACKECIISTIRAAIDEGHWTNIICPLCPNQLEFKDIVDFAATEDFVRYDTLSTRRAMEQIPNFRWCLREGCGSGQIHAPGEQLMLCNACGYRMCYVHQQPWHAGQTCQEFEVQNARRLRVEEDAVKAVIQRTTRQCPSCRVNVEKVEGTCNHMTCRPPVGCGYQFCYECLVKWTGYGRRTTHRRSCSSYIAS